MTKSEYKKATKQIALLAKKKEKAAEEIEQAIKLLLAVQKYELKHGRTANKAATL